MGVWESCGGGVGWDGVKRGCFNESESGGEVEIDAGYYKLWQR